MALTDCESCWETPCMCGHEWRKYSIKDLEDFIVILQRIVEEKKKNALYEKPRRDDY